MVYSKNWSFLVNSYKEFTEFGIGNEDQEVKKVGIGQRMMVIFKSSIMKFLNFTKDVSLAEGISLLITQIMRMIPFIGNIPFLANILGTIFAYIAEYILSFIFQVSQNPEELVNEFLLKFKRVYRVFKKRPSISLDYKEELKDDRPNPGTLSTDEKATLKIEVTSIENTYLESLEVKKETD